MVQKMSDPMTNTEVEDVLASIRRLVSDDKRPETEAEAAPATDRLVLTPSLRVMDDVPAPEPEMEPEAEPFEAEHEAEAVDTDQDDHAAQDTDHDVETEAVEVSDMDVVEETPETAEVSDLDDVQVFDVVEQDDTPETVDLSQMSIDEAFAQGIEEEDTSDREAEAEAPFQEQADEHDAVEETDTAETTDDASDGDDPVDVPSPTLSDKIAALETLIGGRDDQFEPDDAGADAYAGTEPPAMAWEDAEETPPTYAAYAETRPPEDEDDTAETAAQIFSTDEDVLDEEALRDLVSDIVREELQGALGERITRNVRKLVRREIHRALAAQELE